MSKSDDQLNEGIITSLMKSLFSSTIKRKLKKAEKKVKDNPSLQKELEQLRRSHEKAEKSMAYHCKHFPDSDICN